MLVRIAIPLVLLAILGFGVVKGLPLVLGPRIVLSSPADGAVIPDGFLVVSGTAYRIDSLTLNGAKILPEASGHFEKLLVLPSGHTILSLTAADRFGRSTILRRTVVVP
ncbi:MAG: hypothetical protein WDN10_02640 [bacterium]